MPLETELISGLSFRPGNVGVPRSFQPSGMWLCRQMEWVRWVGEMSMSVHTAGQCIWDVLPVGLIWGENRRGWKRGDLGNSSSLPVGIGTFIDGMHTRLPWKA